MKLLLTTLLVCVLLTVSAQNPMLVDAKQSFILTNPSFAGSNGSVRGQFVGRLQWPNLSGRSFASYNSVDAYVKQLHGGVAISGAYTEQASGYLNSANVNIVYAPIFDFRATELKIIPSVQLGYLQTKADAKVFYGHYGTSLGPNYTRNSTQKNDLDVGAGLLFNYKNFYAGGSAFHLNQPEVGLYGVNALPPRYSLNASYTMVLGEKNLMNLSALYNNQMNYGFATLAANMILKNIAIIGAGIVTGDVVFFNLGFRNQYISLVGGMDVTVSRLAGKAVASYQLAFGLRIPKTKQANLPVAFEKW